MSTLPAKFGLTAFIVVFSDIYHSIGVLFVLLILASTLDYLTGIATAIVHKELNSKCSIIGIYRKFSLLLLVPVSVLVELLLKYTGVVDTNYLYLCVTSWLIASEILSIMENIARSGVPIPAMLMGVLEVFGAQQPQHSPHKHKKNNRR